MIAVSFKPQIITKDLVSGLKDRTRDIIVQRYGLGVSPDRKTLEAIGQKYGITRERIRQIENFALNSIRQSPSFDSARGAFSELKEIIDNRGKILSEAEILDYASVEPSHKNHIYFLLVVGDDFARLKEDDDFHHRWTTDSEEADRVHQVLKNLHAQISEEDLIAEEDIANLLRKNAEEVLKRKINDEIIRSWINISKIVASNKLGEWGLASSASIRPRGMRDLAFLVLRKQGSPMHFTEVSKKIEDYFSRSAHSATVHNELIKDPRFVLVGRGLYALGDWGYKIGTVRDVITDIIKTHGPLTKDEITKIVSKERYVKENTILINLQNRDYFKKNKDGKYAIA